MSKELKIRRGRAFTVLATFQSTALDENSPYLVICSEGGSCIRGRGGKIGWLFGWGGGEG